MSKIQSWQEQLKEYGQLSLNNAKDLYREYVIDTNPEKRNTLIESTIYVAVKYAKEYAKSIDGNEEDIISLSKEYYIKEVLTGRLLNIKNFSEIFDNTYKEFITKNLIEVVIEPEEVKYENVEVPNIEEIEIKKPLEKINNKGYSNVVILSIITILVSLGIVVLGVYLGL